MKERDGNTSSVVGGLFFFSVTNFNDLGIGFQRVSKISDLDIIYFEHLSFAEHVESVTK